jgi:hexosaminidase
VGALLTVVPYPRSLQLSEGVCPLGNVRIDCNDPLLSPVADLLAETLPTRPGEAATPLQLNLDATLTIPEAYSLAITPTGVTLAAADPAGAFYAVQTLLQLAFPDNGRTSAAPLPCLHIEDAPTYGWRGMHLDCSRHFFDLTFIKRYIDLLALHKMNRFHWHLCDDQGWRLESAAFPALTEVGGWRSRSVIGHTNNRDRRYEEQRYGGYYTREQVREVVAYAAERHIAVLPEIDIPGHAAALLAAHPELSCEKGQYRVEEHYGIFPDVLCPTEACFAFLETLFTEVAQLFPFEYVHIGGDEVIKDRWRDCDHCQQLMRERGMDSVDRLHGYFVSRVEAILQGLGRRAIGWNEVMDGEISTDTTIMCWTGFDAGSTALRAGHETIMTPVECTYFDFYQSTSVDEPQAIHGLTPLRQVFDFDPMPPDTPAHLRGRILGAQANVWTEYLRDAAAVEYACLPRMSALAEALWTGPTRSWKHFTGRLPAWSGRLRDEGYRVADSAAKPRISIEPGADQILVANLYCDLPGLDVHYTLDGSDPDATSPRYETPLRVDRDCVLRCRSIDPGSGEVFGDERQHLSVHRALHCPVYHWRDESLVPAPEHARLTNGCLGRDRIFHAVEWTAFETPEADLGIDLQQEQDLRGLRLNFEAGAHRQLYYPSGLRVWLSRDGLTWEGWFNIGEPRIAGGAAALDSEPCRGRFLRLQLLNHRRHYDPQRRARVTQPVHIDEIVVI